jgi:hypothetical protein
MSTADSKHPDKVYKIECEDGHRFILYNASVLGNPSDHVPDKWYLRPYPVTFPLGEEVSQPFETAEEAELAARDGHARVDGSSGPG